MNDPGLNNLLKWGIQNSEASRADPSTAPQPMSELDKQALMAVISGMKPKSDAEVMDESLDVIENEKALADDKYEAFENFEMIIQNLDNANNLENNERWTRLIKQLKSEDSQLRMWAAHSCGTAVQNNTRTQERILVIGAIPDLVHLATKDPERNVRKRAITALSSTVRNFQPGLDATLSHMPAEFKPKEELDATDMESVDLLINKLRESL